MDGRATRRGGALDPRRWRLVWTWLAVLPAVLAVVSVPRLIVLVSAVSGLFFAATLRLIFDHDQRGRGVTLPSAGRALGSGLRAALIAVGGVGLLMFSAWLTLVVALTVALSGVIAYRGGRTHVTSPTAHHESQPTGEHLRSMPTFVAIADVQAMDDAQLCHAWRHSFVSLERARGPQERAMVVGSRQALMDELVRRHPEAMSAWLRAGGRAAGGPDRFIGWPDDGDNQPEVA